MEKLTEKIAAVMEPIAEKLQSIAFLQALSATMMMLVPITVCGSFGCLLAFIDIGPWTAFLGTHPGVQVFFMNIQSWTLSIISLYTVIVLAVLYAKELGYKEPLACGVIALAVFLQITPTELYTAIPSAWLGHSGMFSAMIVAFLVVRFCKLCDDKHITIKMPESVPSFVSAAFTALIPAVVLIFAAGIVGAAMASTSFGSIHNVIYTLVQAPFMKVGLSFGGVLIEELIMTLAMFCGIHGSSVVTWFTPLQTAADAENAAAIAAGSALPNIWGTGAANMVQAGGIGATLGLAILMVIICKSSRYKQLSRVAIVPQIFNIGEPLLFGIPIMLNPMLFIPYIGGVVVNFLLVWISIATGFVGRPNGASISWTLPHPLQGLLGMSTPVTALILCVIILVIDMIIWYPFVKIIDREALKEEQAEQQ